MDPHEISSAAFKKCRRRYGKRVTDCAIEALGFIVQQNGRRDTQLVKVMQALNLLVIEVVENAFPKLAGK